MPCWIRLLQLEAILLTQQMRALNPFPPPFITRTRTRTLTLALTHAHTPTQTHTLPRAIHNHPLSYSGGGSESIVGSWLAKHGDRASVILATKVFFASPNGGGLSRPAVLTCVDRSLARLQTTYIDLYQIHTWDAQTAVESWMATMADLVQQGKIRAIGVSNVTGWQLQNIISVAEALSVPIASLQTQYSLLCRDPELELLDCAAFNKVGTLCWSPLKGGWLTGKFKKEEAPAADSRVGKVEAGTVKKLQSNPSYSQFKDDPKVWALLAAMEAVAAAQKKSMPQVALRWCLQRPTVKAVVIGARTPAQLEDNLGASSADGWELTDAEMTSLNEASMPSIPYPYEMVWRVSARGAPRQDGNLWPMGHGF